MRHELLCLLLLLLCATGSRAVELTTTQASCILEAVAGSGYQEGLIPVLRAKLFIHGTAIFTATEFDVEAIAGIVNITNNSNGYKFFPTRSYVEKTDGATLATITFPLTEYASLAGDITISYTEQLFQEVLLMVNTTTHITSFSIPCTNLVSTYLYNAHVFGTVAEFLFTRPVVRCNDSTAETLEASWFIYSNRACEAGIDGDDTGCARSYPKSVSICATSLKPVNNNTMRWWCNYHGNDTSGWSLETYFIQYYLVANTICDAETNSSVKTFDSLGVKVFRQQEDTVTVHPVLVIESTNVGRTYTGFKYVDLQFQFPVNVTMTSQQIYYLLFQYYYGTKSSRCYYHSDGGWPDGQVMRYECFPAVQLDVYDTPAVGMIGASGAYINYYVLNYSSTATSGVDFVNYTSRVALHTETDGVASSTYSTVTPSTDWISAIYYVNETALKLVGGQVPNLCPKHANVICYDTDETRRYNISSTTRNVSTIYLTFDEDNVLPDFAADFIYCYFVYSTPESAGDYGRYPSNPIAVTLEPTESETATSNDDSIFSDLNYEGSMALLIILSGFAFLGLVLSGVVIYQWRTYKANPYTVVSRMWTGSSS